MEPPTRSRRRCPASAERSKTRREKEVAASFPWSKKNQVGLDQSFQWIFSSQRQLRWQGTGGSWVRILAKVQLSRREVRDLLVSGLFIGDDFLPCLEFRWKQKRLFINKPYRSDSWELFSYFSGNFFGLGSQMPCVFKSGRG